ncbi:MAG: choice-of-anchor J domain-containing protein [Bacteroidales bacterium]|nr:choice-of-anchor J domain-containing protein [Bacteroidales bacterium]
MKKTLILGGILISFLCVHPLNAQLSKGGTPHSFQRESVLRGTKIEFRKMPAIDIGALRAEDRINDKLKDIPWRFGKTFEVNLNPKNSGSWTSTEDGKIWQLGITCEGALSINLVFNEYRLPEGAELYLYSADKSRVLGAFTAANNQKDGYFAVHPIPGESIIIEYFEPYSAAFEAKLNIEQVVHAYRDINAFAKAFGASGACNINATCPEGDPISNEIRATVMMILVDGLCTGTLINNTLNDGTPYVLSANHCYSSPGGIVFRFNWESETCENPSVSPSYTSLSGAEDRAVYAPSDMWLLEMNDLPPAGYNVYYAGWNRATISTITDRVWCVHHPRGDIKKISWSDNGIASSSLGGLPGSGTNYWRVSSWSDGTTTEGGSSGAALLDVNHRIIGQLYGGTAACGNTDPDWFGKLSVSWTGGLTNSSRLSNWLDPDNTGFLTLDGFEPILDTIDGGIVAILDPVGVYESPDTINPRFILCNEGSDSLKSAVAYYILNETDSIALDWSGALAKGEKDTLIFPEIILRLGCQNFFAGLYLDGDENPRNNHLSLDFVVADCQQPTLPILDNFDSLVISPCWNMRMVEGATASLSTVSESLNPVSIPSQGMRMIGFNSENANVGASIRLETPALSTEGMDSISVGFDWLHDSGSSFAEDRMIVQFSLDGKIWVNVAEFMRYSESVSGWERKEVLLPDTIDHHAQVVIGLCFISGNGQDCHMDSLVIAGTTIDEPYPDFFASETRAAPGDTIIFTDHSVNGPYTIFEWDFGVGANPETALGPGPHEVVYDSTGYKTVSLTLDELYTRTRINYVLIDDNIFFIPFNLYGEAILNDVYLSWSWKEFTDGFETGDFRNWGDLIEGPGVLGDTAGFPYWYVREDPSSAYAGDFCAATDWGYNLDTWLISREMHVTELSQIIFTWQSSYYWHVENDKGDLFVKISPDGGITWNTLWTFGEIGVWENWTWYQTVLDISEYAGNDVIIAFNIVANDNSEVILDEVAIRDVYKKALPGTRQAGYPASTEYTSKVSGITSSSRHVVSLKTATLIDYSIFRDGEELGKSMINSYLDEGLKSGSYEYYIVGNYTDPVYTTLPSDTIVVVVDYDDIPQPGRKSGLLLYPNPSTGQFSLSLQEACELRITDIRGNTIHEDFLNAGQSMTDLGDQPDGIYLFYLISDNQTRVIRAVKLSE